MRTLNVRLVFLAILLAGSVALAGAQTSVGLMIGEPTGLSAKQWVGGGVAFDAALAWSFRGTGSIYVHVDYQQHFDEFDIDPGRLLLFAGLGGKLYISDVVGLGLRVPLGVLYEFEQAPIEIFFELAPGLDLIDLGPDAGGGFGVRYRL